MNSILSLMKEDAEKFVALAKKLNSEKICSQVRNTASALSRFTHLLVRLIKYLVIYQ